MQLQPDRRVHRQASPPVRWACVSPPPQYLTPCLPPRSAIELDTPLFSGRACVWVRDLPGAPARLFEGRRRRTLVTVQGRFKEPVPLDDLVTGQEFGRVENLPPAWFVEGVLLKVGPGSFPEEARERGGQEVPVHVAECSAPWIAAGWVHLATFLPDLSACPRSRRWRVLSRPPCTWGPCRHPPC